MLILEIGGVERVLKIMSELFGTADHLDQHGVW